MAAPVVLLGVNGNLALRRAYKTLAAMD